MKVHATYTVEVLMEFEGDKDDLYGKVCDQCFTADEGEAVFFNIESANIVENFPDCEDAGEYFLDDYEGEPMKVLDYVI